ncbi:MAG: DUF3427 domain-containing protein [Desulfobacterales bacterium]|nr:DUF3427 domain-containing protein [Desulfobacterales bacterium]MDD4391738.1 DUF3427 domain-containing protein [Desulfobacterales bacterium]
MDRAEWASIDPEELPHLLVIPLAREIAAFIAETIAGIKSEFLKDALEAALQTPETMRSILKDLSLVSSDTLQQIKPEPPLTAPGVRPDTPLSVSALLTGSSRSPALRIQLMKELATCDRADWLVSFIKYSGIVPMLHVLQEFTRQPAPDGGPRLRIATTSYMGATDFKAIKFLSELPNTEIRISYDTRRTRLHAKAYLFHRATGFGSAYIGSANISKAALDEGLEWTAKISQYETEHLWRYAVATFESHWEDSAEFTPCLAEDLPELEHALLRERGESTENDTVSFFDLRPYGYQQTIFEDIDAERKSGKHKHLVIAATGTGKTMIAAFDYKRFCSEQGRGSRLLFVAHREEILKQARDAFRQVLHDGSYGDLVSSGATNTQTDHLFCTVQSWNSRGFNRFAPHHFDYVVLDEAHHASAGSYQNLIDHIKPLTLLGLTATPERMDGKDIRQDFGGAFTHEIRLPEAIERALLSPFHYYGIPDLDELDFSAFAWKRGGYDITQLRECLEDNQKRAAWVMSQTARYVADIRQVAGLGFCVSVEHAKFMARFCDEHNIRAIALHGESPKDVRHQAQQQLSNRQINFIFTVDLYNEGIDIPCVDTVLFLRPTESLTLFLQQLGRGLRLHEEKSHLTVLDFIAPQHHKFSFAKRFQALTSRPELRIDNQIKNGFPFIPSGCLIHLEKQAQEHVLNNIRAATACLRGERLLGELRQLRNRIQGHISLQNILDFLSLDTPDEIFKRGLPHVLIARAEGEAVEDDMIEFDTEIAKGFRRLCLMDDPHLIGDAGKLITTGQAQSDLTRVLLHSVLWNNKRPQAGTLEQVHSFFASRSGLKKDLIELLDWLLQHRTPLPLIQFTEKTGPLVLHASYTREQVLLALGLGSFKKTRASREGVLHVPERKLDVFFADINKSEADFSPTTMYEDYAVNERLFHWQSQSTTGEDTPTGLRYIHHQQQNYTPLLFIRNRNKLSNGLTAPYLFAGPLNYRRHEGSRPMSIKWDLAHSLPARVLSWARLAA